MQSKVGGIGIVGAALAAATVLAVGHDVVPGPKPKPRPKPATGKPHPDVEAEANCEAVGDAPRAASARAGDKHYRHDAMRIGVRINGVERNDITSYDMDRGMMTTISTGKHEVRIVGRFETYWRYPESRQQRRARERAERK